MSQPLQPLEGKPIVAALDLSERSIPCLRYGCDMAAKLGQPLILVHVVHETAENVGMYRRYHRISDTTPLVDIARKMLEDTVASFREVCNELDSVCTIRLVVVPGIPETRIAELAERFDAGMIVLYGHNRHGLGHWLHGSVSESVVRHTERPVVVVGRKGSESAPIHAHRPLRQAVATSHAV